MTPAKAGLAVILLALLAPASARAQSAQAEALFKDGKSLIKQGQLAAGCNKIEASERVESSVGTLLNLGDCREKLGQLATAWAAFAKAEATAKRAGDDEKRRAEAGKRAAALEPRLARLTVQLAAPAPGTRVTLDGKPLEAGAWNSPLPVDPDEYTIEVGAPGFETWRLDVTLDGTTKRRVVVVPPLVRAALTEPAVTAPPPVVVRRAPGTWSGVRVASAVVAAVGVGALGAGVYFGLDSRDLREQSDARCPLTLCADADGLRLNDEAQDAATRANIFYVAGGVALAGAAVLWLVGRPDGEAIVAPTMGNGSVGATLAGRF